MAQHSSTADNCVIHNILSAAATNPGYRSPLDTLLGFVATLGTAEMSDYYNRSQTALNRRARTAQEWASYYNQYITGIVRAIQSNNRDHALDLIFTMLDSI